MQDFPQGGAPTPKIAIIFQIFAKNCMKMKEFGPPGGARVPGAPLRSANENVQCEFRCIRNDICRTCGLQNSCIKNIHEHQSEKGCANLLFGTRPYYRPRHARTLDPPLHILSFQLCEVSGGSRISPRRGRQLPGGATYDFAKFSQKLHEIERIWVAGWDTRPSRPP